MLDVEVEKVELTPEQRRQLWIESFDPKYHAIIAQCEQREVGDELLPVLVIDSAEKWEAAASFSIEMNLEQSNTKRLRIPMTGISQAEWDKIETSKPIPELEADEQPPAGFEEHREMALVDRKIAILEKATGKTFPGKEAGEKRDFYLQRSRSEQTSLTIFIDRDLCNFPGSSTMPRTGPLVEFYESQLAASEPTADPFGSFEDWKAASEVQHVYRMQRAGQPYIIEFPLRAVPAETHKKITNETREPEPEKVPVMNAMTGKFMPGQFEIKRRDPVYQRKLRAAHQQRCVRYFNACLMFTLPGQNEKEQYDWLAQRLVGDVVRVREYIEDVVMGIGNRYSFFTNG